MQYKKLNNLLGWLSFVIAATVYGLTMERNGSWWDCGEFISCVNGLQVPHQPGAPLFIMITKIITLLSFGNTHMIAIWGNMTSALSSAGTILFLFWTITALAKKMVKQTGENISLLDAILIFGSGFVGSLAYTFSDTFWFSAVESEVYAMASLTVALTYWAVLKWEARADDPKADRWLIFIGLIIGLSVGVHLMNLLTIPAVVFIVYFRRFEFSWKGFFITLIVSVGLLGFVMSGIVPGTVKLMGTFDRIAVNDMGMPQGTGVIFFTLLLIAFIVGGIIYSARIQNRNLNTAFLALAFCYIGLACFLQVPIRAHAHPPLNNNNPDDPYSFLEYLTRSQYGEGAPLLSGPYFTSNPTSQEKQGSIYKWNGKNYQEIGQKIHEVYNSDEMIPFPRIWDNDDRLGHVTFYRNWLGLKEGDKPQYSDNLKFFFSYQIGFMYGRYFMWNFAGRQNDIQGDGRKEVGNWISGIPPLDYAMVGKPIEKPSSVGPNKAYNTLFLLPFILGIFGLYHQSSARRNDFLSVLIFFLFTGIGIIVYLNQTGLEPRERDYAFGGSYYAFCIWIGFSVIAITELVKKYMKPMQAASITFMACLLAGPVLMANQEWDDHDRSQRSTVRDIASDYLNSCAKNAIIFTYGDNDTYPLWYAQEVEKIRPDIRIVNLSLLGIDWYVKQMHEPMNESSPLPFGLASEKYFGEYRNQVPFYDAKFPGRTELKDVMDLIGSEDPAAKVQYGDMSLNFLPTKSLKMTINADEVIKSGTLPAKDSAKIVKAMEWNLTPNYLLKNDIAELDIIANNHWKRPIYFAKTLPGSAFQGLKQYCHLEGLAYRLLPIKAEKSSNDEYSQVAESVNMDPMYDNLMHKFAWGNMKNAPFLDLESRSMVPTMVQSGWNLAYSLYKVGKKDSATKVLDKVMAETPPNLMDINDRASLSGVQTNLLVSSLYYKLNNKTQANKIIAQCDNYVIGYLNAFKENGKTAEDENVRYLVQILNQMVQQVKASGDIALTKKLNDQFRLEAGKFGFPAGPEQELQQQRPEQSLQTDSNQP